MASCERRATAVVLKKTKLGESDLIVHLMDNEGCAVRAVAKGARKPTNANSAQLDLFNTVQVTLVSGKNLDIAKDTRLVKSNATLMANPVLFAAACVIAEAADVCIQPSLPVAHLFDMTTTALACLSVPPNTPTLVVAAYLIKLTALLGMRPSFATCTFCEAPLTPQESARLSYDAGGYLCAACAHTVNTIPINAQTLANLHALLTSRFAAIATLAPEENVAWDVLEVAANWFSAQTSARLRSYATFKSVTCYTPDVHATGLPS